MLEPDAEYCHLSEQIELPATALLALVAVIRACSELTTTPQPEQSHAANNT
jgi:hypothetical protein